MLTDYYKVLQVPRDADAALLRAAYRRLAKSAHPDARPDLQGPSREAQARRFILLAQAYRVLSDPVQRRAHDRTLGPEPAETGSRGAAEAGQSTRRQVRRPGAGAGAASGKTAAGPGKGGGGPDVTLDELLQDVDDLLGRFGLDLRASVERRLEALLDWARRFYAEMLAAWREEGAPQPGQAGARGRAEPHEASRTDSQARPRPRGSAPRRPSAADVEAELARIKRELKRSRDPDP